MPATKEHKATKTSLRAAAVLGRRMFRQDKWIEPVFDSDDNYDDYGVFADEHRSGWEETNQCQRWIDQLCDLSEDAALRQGIDRNGNWEKWFYNFHIPMKEAFWDAWEEATKMAEKWEKAVVENKV
jgi:hypothetical protein